MACGITIPVHLCPVCTGFGRVRDRLSVEHVPIPPNPPAPTLEETKASWSASSTTTAILMLAIGLPFRLHHLAALGGLSRDILLFLSPTYVVESGLEIGGVPTLFESFFDWGALLLVLRAIVTRKHRYVSLCVLLVALLLAYLESGKRSAVVPFLLYPIVWVHYLKRRITLKRGLVY